MKSTGSALLVSFFLLSSWPLSGAQVAAIHKDGVADARLDTLINPINCKGASSTILLNSVKDKDDWQIISGPPITAIQYPLSPNYTKPFPSWEMDRYTADSSYFRDCDWMVLPDKRTVINTTTRVPVVLVKQFTTTAPSKLKLIVKMLYDNMAYLYIDSTWITLSHQNADVNRFIKKLRPELSGFVSIPATFNFSYNASYYAGDFFNLVLPKGDHTIKIELFNNAYELGCIIKGMLISENDEKIFCDPPIKEAQSELASILLFRDEKAFPQNEITEDLYAGLMHSVKKGCWMNNFLQNEVDLISNDTLFINKGEKLNLSPVFITEFYNGEKDTAIARGNFKKISTAKSMNHKWERTFVFDAIAKGNYWLEINCETPADFKHKAPDILTKYARIVKVR